MTLRPGSLLGLGAVALWMTAGAAHSPAQLRLLMTRPQEAIAIIDGMGRRGTFAELAGGRILYSGGGGRFSVSSDGGVTWPVSWTAQDADGNPLGNGESSLIRLSGNSVGYATRARCDGPAAPGCVVFYRSEDEGRTWSKAVRVSPPADQDVVAKLNDVLLRTASGRVILPLYACMPLAPDSTFRTPAQGAYFRGQWVGVGAHDYDPQFCWSLAYYSDDEGRSWKSSRGGKIVVWDVPSMTWNRTTEPSVAEVSPGRLVMVLRSELGRVYQSWSNDNGETWTAPKPTLLAASSSPAQIRTIPGTEDLLIVWSQAGEDDIRNGLGRSRLSSAISRKHGAQGAVWEFFQNVASVMESVRVEPGPLRRARPEGVYYGQGEPAAVREGKHIIELPDNYALTSYPCVFFYKGRVLIGHSTAHYQADGKYVNPGQLRVLPLSWLYGGAENMKSNEFRQNLRERFPGK